MVSNSGLRFIAPLLFVPFVYFVDPISAPKMKRFTALLTLALFTLAPLRAQDAETTQAAIHALRETLTEAINKADWDAMAACLHPDVVITYQNAEVARGRADVKAYQQKMTTGPEAILASFRAAVKQDALTILPGGTAALATGSSVETYDMVHGSDLILNGRWTATVVKADGQWLVAALHCSADLFKNPIVAATKKAGTTASIGSIIIGLIAGWFIGRKRVI